jgi:sugar porter (SP) family MFS transporter
MAFLNTLSGRPLIVLITIASSCGFLLFGFDNGVFSGVIVLPWFLAKFNHPNTKLLGTISAMYNVGGFLGGLVAFFVGSRLGRRRTILTGLCICAVGAIIQCAATELGELIAGRLLCGVGVGIMTSTVGLWQAEVVQGRSRGMYLTLQVLGGAAGGVFLAQWINYGFHKTPGRVAFVFPLAFQLVFVTLSGILVSLLPESPRWLVKQGRRDEARAILARLDCGEGEYSAEARLAQIEEAVELEMGSGEGQLRQLVSSGPTQNLRRLCLACGTMIMHQLNGVNTVTYYMPTLLMTFARASHDTSLWVTGLTSISSMVFALIPVLTIDRFGRRPFLWGGAVMQSLVWVIIAVLLANAPPPSDSRSHSFGVATVAMIFLYYCLNAATWLGPSWAYPAEILPLQVREKGLALGNVCYWLFQFMMVEITPIALGNIGYKFYIILAVFNAVDAVIVYFLFPETKGLTLEEIDFQFAERYTGPVPKAHEGASVTEKTEMGGTAVERLESA